MKRALAVVAVAVGAVVAVDVLADYTQTRPDPRRHTSMEIVFDVSTRNPKRPALLAAQGLWGACQGTVYRTTGAGAVEVEGRRARVVVHPALGTHGQRRLRGCLEDVTVDRVKADVVHMREL
ncbi:MAG TPA: hypothetical protein VHF47_01400 [Acidimicrobiales bacterium]|nr:hypothetical protein [Acidimicrobiales bacterium]